ncbi:LAMI_0C00210g1_1 [Lachancea mirantina]|uniref:LAMI_0C00210g1_1 n=1 Tax=Lachancea mirantina TaxID=1230905 RepID=A0A1G4IZD2_9SACH|nr:LAMI_0C00210g1_1 [Lachancea mirantina]
MTISTENQTSYLFQGNVTAPGSQVVSGKGIHVDIEKDGVVYENVLDAVTGAAVGALAWGDEDVFEIMDKAARESTYQYPSLISNKSAEELAKFYIDNSEGAFCSALWCCSGSESNENALRIIRQYYLERGLPNKVKLISRESSYHGFTLGAQSLSWNPRIAPFEPYLMDRKNVNIKISCAYTYRYKKKTETEEDYTHRLLQELETKIVENDPDTIAAVTVETLPGSSLGTTPPPKGYLKGIRALCTKYDIIFHLDEVMCGTGRCNPNGRLNCWENYLEPSEAPDIQTVGKTLGSGYVTIAGVLIGPKIRNAYVQGSGAIAGGHTYSCHSFNCAVALGVQKKIKKENLTSNMFKMGNLLAEKLKDVLLAYDNIAGDVRGVGGFQSIEFVKDRNTKEAFDISLNVGPRFKAICFENGLCVMGMPANPDGSCSDRALLAPSFVINERDVDEIVEKTNKSVKELSDILKKEGSW